MGGGAEVVLYGGYKWLRGGKGVNGDGRRGRFGVGGVGERGRKGR